MNTGQMLLTIGALMLLSIILLRINRVFLTTNTVLYETKYNVMALSLATSLIEEAQSKAFDKNTVTNPTLDLTTLSTTLGKDTGENYPNFDDVDDFNGYTRSTAADTTLKSAVYDISCSVNYINSSTPNQNSATRTWHKRISVSVRSDYMQDTIRISSIFSYWYFR